MVFWSSVLNGSYIFSHISPCVLYGGRFDVFCASQCYLQIFVHTPSCKNHPYNRYPHPSLYPYWLHGPSPSFALDFGPHIYVSVMRVALISMLMRHPASNIISPCGLRLHSIPLQPRHLLLIGHSLGLVISWVFPPLKY